MVSPERAGGGEAAGVPRVEARGLAFAYDGRTVLHGIDLHVDPGEVVGLLGPNGSGKSTVIRLLSGVLGGYAGSARLEGNEISGMPQRELARSLAVVPQEPLFSFPFSALEVALMGRHPHLAGLAFESERDLELAREALKRCGAADLAPRSILELSSGERQRVVFARALAQQPRALLLDEPASFLDIRHQVELYDTVRLLVEERRCGVLTVMHDLNLAAEYCDRIYLLRDGRIEAGGSTAEVFTYANLTRVFDTEIYVDTNTLTGKLLVVPLPGRVQEQLKER
jgi:iron complex transport system ATP-binding protein